MKHKVRLLGSTGLFVLTFLLLLTTQVWAQGPEGFAEYVLHLQPPGEGMEATKMWFWTRGILSDLQANDLVHQFECVEEEHLCRVYARQEGLHQLQKLEWVVRIERQTDHGPETVYDIQQPEKAGVTVPVAPLAPNTVTGLVDLPDGMPVQDIRVNADEVDGWGWDYYYTDPSGMYTLTLDSDGWWDISLGLVPWPHSSSYARPLDWKRRLNITSDVIQNFTLIPISYAISGTVRVTGTGELVQWQTVRGDRTDGGHSPTSWTDFNGVYSLDVTTGTYTVTLSATSSSDGYAPPFESGEVVDVPGSSVGDVDLWVVPLDRVIAGVVTDKDTGEPIGDAMLNLERTDGLYYEYEIRTATGGLTGTYAVSVTSGVYEISLDSWGQPSGYALPVTTTQRVTVTTSDVSGVDFVLLPANRSISGRVTVRDTGTGVGGVEMRLSPGWIYTETTSSGYYTFTNLAEGDYTVSVTDVPTGYVKIDPTSRQVEVTATSRSGIDFEVLVADRTIRGTVREVDGSGIPGVDIEAEAYDSDYFYNPSTSTDASGAYTFTVPVGYFSIRLTLPSGYAGRRHLRAPAGASGVDFILERRSETIRGRVVDHLSNPLAGVSVYAANYDCYDAWWSGDDWGGHDAEATTDADGYYTLTVIPGSYEIRVSKTGYPTPPYQDAASGESGVDFAMPEGFLIRGRVTAGGAGVADADIYAYSRDECASERHDQATTSDASGYYTLTVDAGTYSVSASKWRYDSPPAQCVIVGPDQSGVDFDLTPRYRVTGIVRYPNGQPVYDAWVRTAYGGPSYDSDWISSWDNGQYELYVAAGTYDIVVDIENWPDPATRTGLVVVADTPNVDFTAPEAYTVSGTVRRSDGTPWGGIGVRAEDLSPLFDDEYDWTDAEGGFALHVRQGGTYAFYPARWTYPANPVPITLTVNADTSGVDFQFGTVVTVTGMVRDSDGIPVPNADVDIDGKGTNGVENEDWAATFYDGTYVLFFAEGSYGGDASKWPCYEESDWRPFTLGVGGISNLDFTIARKCGTVSGRVIDGQGNPVCDASVRIGYPDGGLLDFARTAEDWHGQPGIGTYRTLVPVGTWVLTVFKTGYGATEPPARTVEIAACGATVTGQDFQFAPAGALDHFTFDFIDSQLVDQPFSIRITARDADGLLVSDYNGSANLTDSTGTIAPTSVTFANGVFNGCVTIGQPAADVMITAIDTTDPAITGTSNPFDVSFGPTEIVVDPGLGGTLVYTDTQDNPTTLVVPPGAVTDTTTIVFVPVETIPVPPGWALGGYAFDLDAYREGNLIPDFTFEKTVTLTIKYSDADVAGLAEDTLALYRWTGDEWEKIGTRPGESYTLDTENNVLTAKLRGLSKFGKFGASTERQVFLPVVLRDS